MAEKASGSGFCDQESDSELHKAKVVFANQYALK